MQTAVQACVDWLGVTFRDGTPWLEVAERFGIEGWTQMDRGDLGYRQAWRRGHVQLLFDGAPGMGVHVEVSGQGCRELEAADVVKTWGGFLGSLKREGASWSRLDVALDDRQGLVEMGTVQAAIPERTVVSRYRTWQVQASGTLDAPEQEGVSIRFGSARSDTMVRFYDKAAQTGTEGHWTRVELQTRDAKAEQLAAVIVERGVGAIAGVLAGLLEFKTVGTHSQRERWARVSWWAAFLGVVEKLRLTVTKVVQTVHTVYAWLERQVAPMLATLDAARPDELRWVQELIRAGRVRMKQHHWQLVGAVAG